MEPANRERSAIATRRLPQRSRLLLTTALAGITIFAFEPMSAWAQNTRDTRIVDNEEEQSAATRETANGTTVLEAIVISGDGGGIPPAYAGGQVAKGSRVGILGNKDVMETPFSTVSYTDEYMQNREAQDIGSVIGTDPSVYVPNKRNVLESYYIRGFPTSATSGLDDITFNGLVGMAPYVRGVTEFAERIEVLKGPSTFLNGMPPGGSVGGSVNIVPKRAGDVPLTRLTTSYASDSLGGVHVDVGRRFGDNKEWGIRVNGVLRDGNTAVNGEEHGLKMGSVALDYQGERARVSLDYYKVREEMEGINYFGISVGPMVTVLPEARNGKHSIAPPWSFSIGETDTIVLRGEYDITDAVTAYGAIGRRTGGRDALVSSSMLLNDAWDIAVTGLHSASDGTQYSGEVGLRGNFMTGNIGHDWNIAATGFDSDTTFKDMRYSNHWFTNWNNLDFGPEPDRDIYDSAGPTSLAKQRLTSFAVSDTMSLFDERLLLTFGLRHQTVESSNDNLMTGARTSSYEASRTSPAIAALYRASDSLSFYANYIEGLSPGATAPLTASNAGEILSPYQTRQIEVGAKWELGDFTTTLALFQIEKPNAYTDPVTNVFGAYGEQRNRGVELNIFGEVRPGLRVLGGVTYIDPKMTKALNPAEEGKVAAGTPAFMAKFGVEYDVDAVPGLTLTGSVNHTGKRYVNAQNTLSLPDFTTLDLGARYTTEIGSRPLTVRAAVQNVTNEAYWAGGSLAHGFGPPRTFLLSATMDF